MNNKEIPCEQCITLAVCKNRSIKERDEHTYNVKYHSSHTPQNYLKIVRYWTVEYLTVICPFIDEYVYKSTNMTKSKKEIFAFLTGSDKINYKDVKKKS